LYPLLKKAVFEKTGFDGQSKIFFVKKHFFAKKFGGNEKSSIFASSKLTAGF
jgi:hypothetical protein